MIKKINIYLFVAVLCFCGTASAGTMAIIDNKLEFALDCNEPLLLPGSNDYSELEVAKIEFNLKFINGDAPTSDITYIEFTFTYDDDKFAFINAVAGPEWTGSVDCAEPYYCEDGFVKLRLNGTGTPSNDWGTFAYINLEPLCQLSGRWGGYSNFNFDDQVDKGLSCGNDWYNAAAGGNTSTFIATYDTDFTIGNASGLMGDKVLIPVYFQQDDDPVGTEFPHRLKDVTHVITFDDEKLEFTGNVYPNNDAFLIYGDASTSGTCPVEVFIEDFASSGYIKQPTALGTPVKLYDMEFKILGHENGPGSSIDVEFVSADQTIYTDEYCDLIQVLLQHDNSNGDIDIPDYSAEMKFTTSDLYLDKGDVVTFTAEIKNNFPAGAYDDGDTYGALENVLEIPDFLTAGPITDHNGLDFGGGALQNGERIFQAKQSYHEGWTNYVQSPNDFTDMYTTTFFTMPTYEPDYSDRNVQFTWLNHAVVATVDYYTRVADTTSYDTLDLADLTTSADGFEIHIGLFHAPFCYDDDLTVSQPVWVASNFDAADFHLEAYVSGNAKFSSVVSNMTGVVASKTGDYDAEFYWDGTGDFSDHPSYDDSVQIATINYRLYHDTQAGKIGDSGPGGGDGSHYVYGYLTFDEDDSWIEDDQSVEHYLELDPHNVRGYCYHGIIINPPIEKDHAGGLPVDFALHDNHPNPFNPNTILSYDVPVAQPVLIEVFNILGQKIITLVDEIKTPGTHEVEWNGTDESGYQVASGIYLYHMQAGDFTQSKKMMLMK